MRYLTSGESHGPQLTAIIEGIPAGLPLTEEMVNIELAKRQKGYGRGGRMKIESDKVQILGGVRHGVTLGSPITLVIQNRDSSNWGQVMSPHPVEDLEYDVKKVPRPGHADLVGAIKYGHRDLRNVLERSSARETAIRVAVGAVAKQILKQIDIEVLAHVIQIGKVKIEQPTPMSIAQIKPLAADSLVSCIDAEVSKNMCEHIDEAKVQGDSLGGIVEILVENVPLGLGSYVHYDRKIDAKLSAAMMSVQSIKGVYFGDADFASSNLGSQVHDQITYEDGFRRSSNVYGGIEGGMTNGMPLVMKAFVKPIPTLYRPLNSVHIESKAVEPSMIERSDTCVVPAAGVVLEAVVAIEVATAILETFQSDVMTSLVNQVKSYREEVKNF